MSSLECNRTINTIELFCKHFALCYMSNTDVKPEEWKAVNVAVFLKDTEEIQGIKDQVNLNLNLVNGLKLKCSNKSNYRGSCKGRTCQ